MYVDDYLIHNQSWDEHLELLDKILISLDRAGAKINIFKCQ